MSVTIAVAVPTIGRPSLDRTLDAIVSQGLIEGDQIFVVYDRHLGPFPELRARVEAFGPHLRYLEHDHGVSFKGVFQTNKAIFSSTATLTLSHSDDDVFVPGAFTRLRAVADAHPHQPILFRTVSPKGNVTWPDGHPQIRRHHLGGGSLAAPRAHLRPYHYPCEGIDYYWVCEIVAQAAGDGYPPVMIDDILMRSRNQERRV